MRGCDGPWVPPGGVIGARGASSEPNSHGADPEGPGQGVRGQHEQRVPPPDVIFRTSSPAFTGLHPPLDGRVQMN